MPNGYLKKLILSLTIMLIAFGISACGRKGPLDPPPSAQILTDETNQEAPAPPKPDNPFFLDPLI